MTVPAQILDLSCWKITLPTGSKNKPAEIKQPDIATQASIDAFCAVITNDGWGVRFRAAVNGVTTSGSSNPRSELREMKPPTGKTVAKWSAADGKSHALYVAEAFTHLPNARTDGGNAGVVGAQIHNDDDDLSVFRLEGSKLYVTKGDDTHYALADDKYVLGTKYEAAFVVYQSSIKAYYNGKLVATIPCKDPALYFKAGCYTQANSSNSKPNDATNYGEVVVYDVKVIHSDKPIDIIPVDTPPVETPPVETPPVSIPKAKRTIIMLRHGEKDDNGDGKDDVLHELSVKGNQRRVALTAAWTGGKTPAGLPKPDRYIASKGKTDSNRPLKTIQGIQVANNGPMNSTYDFEKDYKTVAPWLAQRLDVTMVCLEHSAIIDTFKLLGTVKGLPKAWDEKRFDLYWIFTSDDGKNWTLTQIPQMLLPGDSDKPIK